MRRAGTSLFPPRREEEKWKLKTESSFWEESFLLSYGGDITGNI